MKRKIITAQYPPRLKNIFGLKQKYDKCPKIRKRIATPLNDWVVLMSKKLFSFFLQVNIISRPRINPINPKVVYGFNNWMR